MNKRTTAFIAAAVMALSLAACGETSGESKSDKSAVNSTAETTAADDNAEEDSAAETTTTTAAESSAAESTETSSAEEATSVAGMSITLPEIDTFFSDIDGKTLDEVKAAVESKFQVGECEEKIDAFRLPDGTDLTAIQVDMYTWNFSSGFNIEDVAFDSLGVSVGNGAVYSFSFYKSDASFSDESSLQEKADSYGYEKTSNGYSEYYIMNCGEVTIDRVTEDSLSIIHQYQEIHYYQ
ncbi:unknown [Ruminococcus sp. CAG:579]|nr:unknown [Ruminococcus sp. CAG:579]